MVIFTNYVSASAQESLYSFGIMDKHAAAIASATPIVQAGELYTYLNSTYFRAIAIVWYFIGALIGIFTLWSSVYMVEVLSSENILDF